MGRRVAMLKVGLRGEEQRQGSGDCCCHAVLFDVLKIRESMASDREKCC